MDRSFLGFYPCPPKTKKNETTKKNYKRYAYQKKTTKTKTKKNLDKTKLYI